MAIRVDWAKWRQFFRGLQENPLLEDIFASGVESQETTGASSDWRLKIESAAPEEREAHHRAGVRDVVGSVLRVKPESLRDDQPLTDLGLDSLMGAEIENSIESAIGVGLPPTSLMRARTIGQIADFDRRSHGWRDRWQARHLTAAGDLLNRRLRKMWMSTRFPTKRLIDCSTAKPASRAILEIDATAPSDVRS